MCAGGPKLRKWYGAPDQRGKDGGDSQRDEDKKGGPNLFHCFLTLFGVFEWVRCVWFVHFLGHSDALARIYDVVTGPHLGSRQRLSQL